MRTRNKTSRLTRTAAAGKKKNAFLPKKQNLERAARTLTDREKQELAQYEQITLRKLTMYLRRVLNTLERTRKFKEFLELPSSEDFPDYYEVIEKPVSLSAMYVTDISRPGV